MGLDPGSTAHIYRLHQNSARRGGTLARSVRVWGGLPELRRGSVRRATRRVDGGGPPGTGGIPGDGMDQWRPSPPSASVSGKIGALRAAACSGVDWRRC